MERCVVDATDLETTTVNTALSTPIRTQMEYANVTHYGTLTGVTFHTKHVTSAVEPATARSTMIFVLPASVDSTLMDSAMNVTISA